MLWIIPLIIVIVIISLVAYAATARSSDIRYHSRLQKTLRVSSNSFQDQQEMPADFSCRGRAMTPDIQWTGAPAGTNSYALIAMDWDAPSPKIQA